MAGTDCRSCWQQANHLEWRWGRGWRVQQEGSPRLAPWRDLYPSELGTDPVENLHSTYKNGCRIVPSVLGRGDRRADPGEGFRQKAGGRKGAFGQSCGQA